MSLSPQLKIRSEYMSEAPKHYDSVDIGFAVEGIEWRSKSPVRSPTTFGFNRETLRRAQRSRSITQRLSGNSTQRRLSISASSPSRPASPTKHDESTFLPASINELRMAVLDLFVSISRQDSSPLQITEPSYPEDNPMFDISTLLQMERGRQRDILQPVSRRSKSRSRPPHFMSMEWSQQRLLLGRELRRLIKWDYSLGQEDIRPDVMDLDRTVAVIESALCSIGTALVELLGNGPQFTELVDRFERLPRNVERNDILAHIGSPSLPDAVAVDREVDVPKDKRHDPLDVIKTAIDDLYAPLHPLKRKNSTSELTMVNERPAKLSIKTGIDTESISMREPRAEAPRNGRKVRFSFVEPDDSHVESDDSDVRRTVTPIQSESRSLDAMSPLVRTNSMSSALGSLRGSESQFDSLQTLGNEADIRKRKIILKIADHVDAFDVVREGETAAILTPVTENTRPQIKRIPSTTVSTDFFHSFDVDDVSLLGEAFENLRLTPDFSSAGIANELLHIARAVVEPTTTKKERMTDSQSLTSGQSRYLQRLDSLLGIFASLPAWRIYTTPDGQRRYAKSAMSMIYFSLLEEVVSCALEFSRELLICLGDGQKSDNNEADIAFFCACIQRLSDINEDMDTGFDTFQPQLQRVIKKLSALGPGAKLVTLVDQKQRSNMNTYTPICKDCGPQPDSAEPTGNISAHYSFRTYEPLSLACYLGSATGHDSLVISESGDSEVPVGLESLTVSTLFTLTRTETVE